MKALHVNLASRPYRDRRRFLLVAGTLLVVVLLLTANNAWTAFDYLSNTETVRDEITTLEARLAQVRSQTATAQGTIEKIDQTELNRRISYVNAQIAERAFSWNALLNDLERVLPDDVRIIQLNPAFAPGGSVDLSLTLEAKSQEGIIRLLDRMIADGSFARAFPQSEQLTDSGIHRFTVSAEYKGANSLIAGARGR